MAGYYPELALLSLHRAPTPLPDRIRSPALRSASTASPSPTTTSHQQTWPGVRSSFSSYPRRAHSCVESYRPSQHMTSSTAPGSPSDTMQSSSPISPGVSPTMKMSSTPPAIPPRASSLKQRHSMRIFSNSPPREPAGPKPKRKKLVRKHSSQPAFEILNPKPAPPTSSSEAQGNAPANAEQNTSPVSRPATANKPQVTKPIPPPLTLTRASPPPLLPELDFGSPTSSAVSTLFDPSIHQPTPTAQIKISILPRPPALTFPPTTPTTPSTTTTPTYRCDIHASHGASHTAIEAACQSLVLSAGGRLLDSYFYPGGFLYSLPVGAQEPIGSGDVKGAGARIEVRSWVPFQVARFDGLRMHPPGGRLGGEVVEVGEGWSRFRSEGWGRGEREDKGVKEERSESEGEVEDAATTPRQGLRRSVLGLDGAALTSMRSLRRLKCRSSRDMELGAGEVKVSSPTTLQSLREKGDHQFTVMSYASDSGDSDESGNEEWESVRSELDS